MTPPRVVNLRCEGHDVYIGRGRGSIFGNPYVISAELTRDDVIRLYEGYARRNPAIMSALPSLTGKRLGCFCHPLACHGDVLVKLWREWYDHRRGNGTPA